MIYDCFTFFNELDLLDIRLYELADIVDVFVLVESPLTFQGKPKPLCFRNNSNRFKAFEDQIRHIVVDDMPDGDNPWEREFHQRNSLKLGLHDAAADDCVLISDADEIARPEVLKQIAEAGSMRFLEQDLSIYFLDWRAMDRPTGTWAKAYAGPAASIMEMQDLSAPRFNDPSYARSLNRDPEFPAVEGAGWHFSWLGGVEKMLEKLDATSHTEATLQIWREPGRLTRAIADRIFFAEGVRLMPVALSEMPKLVREQPDRFRRAGLLSSGF